MQSVAALLERFCAPRVSIVIPAVIGYGTLRNSRSGVFSFIHPGSVTMPSQCCVPETQRQIGTFGTLEGIQTDVRRPVDHQTSEFC